jgi:hypothetical protein
LELKLLEAKEDWKTFYFLKTAVTNIKNASDSKNCLALLSLLSLLCAFVHQSGGCWEDN